MLTLLVLAVAAPVIEAKSCHKGGVYCGASLLNRGNLLLFQILRLLSPIHRHTSVPWCLLPCSVPLHRLSIFPFGRANIWKGNYRDHIVETLQSAGQSTDERHIQSSIFDCLGDGDIRYRGFCSQGCAGVGSDNPDYCL